VAKKWLSNKPFYLINKGFSLKKLFLYEFMLKTDEIAIITFLPEIKHGRIESA